MRARRDDNANIFVTTIDKDLSTFLGEGERQREENREKKMKLFWGHV